MENLDFELTAAMLALVPVVAALLQMLKRIPQVALFKEWLPVASITLSFGLLYAQGIPQPIIQAIVVGLMASGGYDLLKGGKGLDTTKGK